MRGFFDDYYWTNEKKASLDHCFPFASLKKPSKNNVVLKKKSKHFMPIQQKHDEKYTKTLFIT